MGTGVDMHRVGWAQEWTCIGLDGHRDGHA